MQLHIVGVITIMGTFLLCNFFKVALPVIVLLVQELQRLTTNFKQCT